VLSLGAVAAIRATVDDGSAGAVSRLAVGGLSGAAGDDGHDHEHDGAASAASHAADGHEHDDEAEHGHDEPGADLSDDDDFDDDSDHEHGDGHGHDDDVSQASHGTTTGATHGHPTGGSTGSNPGDSHSHTPSTGSSGGGGHTHAPPPVGGGTTTPTTAHHHPTPPPTGGGTTTPTTSHQHPPPPPAGPVQLDDLPANVRDQVTAVRDWAMQYPTAQSSSAAGYSQITVFFHGIAAHYMNFGLFDATFDPARPEVLLYGEQGQLVGVNYIVYSGSSPPAGYDGDDDHWHEHPTLCRSTSSGLIIAGEETSAAACAAMGGTQMSFAGWYLLHVWCIPGWESPEGIFSHENSRV
jgi:hypothetical protein